jgi:hypothetical protein
VFLKTLFVFAKKTLQTGKESSHLKPAASVEEESMLRLTHTRTSKVARRNARTATQILAGQMMRGIVARSITLLTVKFVEHMRLIMGRMAKLRMRYAADALREILLEHLLVLLPIFPVLVPA